MKKNGNIYQYNRYRAIISAGWLVLCLLSALMTFSVPVQAQQLLVETDDALLNESQRLKTIKTKNSTNAVENWITSGSTKASIGRGAMGKTVGDVADWVNPYSTSVIGSYAKGGGALAVGGSDLGGSVLDKSLADHYTNKASKDVLKMPEIQSMVDILAQQTSGDDYALLLENRKRIEQALFDQLFYLTQSYYQDSEDIEAGINMAAYKAYTEMKGNLKKINQSYDQAIAEGKSHEEAVEAATQNELAKVSEYLRDGCPTTLELKEKYQSGCWSCLVVEKLVSSFLTVSKKAYPLSQKAGLILLGIGSVMWILMWGLKNLSSFTQLEPANIVSELMKFLFKVALAYFFIIAGLKIVSTYFINPIMGFGAVIAQQFWNKDIKSATEDYIWEDYDYADIDKQYQKAKTEQDRFIKGELSDGTEAKPLEVSPEQAQKIQIAKEKPTQSVPAQNLNIQIPVFQLPGTAGTFSSPYGCRPAPTTNGGSGSRYHRGVDISAAAGTPVYAIGAGTITYSYSNSGGYTATIVHNDAGGKWTSTYMHMLAKSSDFAVNYNRAANPSASRAELFKVAQGQQIGFVGNTGQSGGNHLHLAVKYGGAYLDPLSLINKKVEYGPKNCAAKVTESTRTPAPEGFVRDKTTFDNKGRGVGNAMTVDLSSTYIASNKVAGDNGSASYLSGIKIADVKYSGPTDIMSASVMNSILGATKVITDTVAENMVLGNAVTCYATLDKGGAWHLAEGWWNSLYITNVVMWIEGALIWCTGFLLTLAVAYYLLDICFKIGFAVIALPIVVGLWPFNMTKGKFAACISIIAKSAATFAFLAITTSYAMNLISAGINGSNAEYDFSSSNAVTADSEGGNGLDRLYKAMDAASDGSGDRNDSNVQYVSARLAVFSVDFIILIFCFFYSYKLIGGTVKMFVDKFFPDQVFGGANPMHSWSTAATRWVNKQVMKPVTMGRDIALHQSGKLAQKAVGGTIGLITSRATRAKAANLGAKAAGGAVKGVGKGVEYTGKGIKAVSKAANAIPVVGQAIAAAGTVAGAAVEAGGKVVQQAGQQLKKSGKKDDKADEKKSGAKDNKQ